LNAKSQNEITHLFTNSKLDSLPLSFENFTNLIHLDFSNNQIQKSPSSISKLTQLRYLDMSNNIINDQGAQVVSDLIQKSKEIILIDLRRSFSSYFPFFFLLKIIK